MKIYFEKDVEKMTKNSVFKRIVAMVLCITMVFGSVPVTFAAETDGGYDQVADSSTVHEWNDFFGPNFDTEVSVQKAQDLSGPINLFIPTRTPRISEAFPSAKTIFLLLFPRWLQTRK